MSDTTQPIVHTYRTSRPAEQAGEGAVEFGPTPIEGRFGVERVDGQVRPVVIAPDGGRAVLDRLTPLFDVCCEDVAIPVWVDGQPVCSTVAGEMHYLEWGADGPEPPQPVGAVAVPNYMLIESELSLGRPHPGMPGGLGGRDA